MKKEELRYLQRLAELYPTIGKASTEIINLQSILNLPKGTEHFMSDLHGEYEAFSHVLRNGSGAVRKKIDDVFGHTLSNNDKRALATLIYYPKEKIQLVKKTEEDMENWYKITLYRLIEVCKTTASKYTRSKVRKALPPDYAYVIEELITEKAEVLDNFTFFVMLQFWNLFNARVFGTTDSAFKGLSKSYGMELIVLAILVGQFLIVQFGGAVFRTEPLDWQTWLLIIGVSSMVLWVGELIRLVQRSIHK